MLRPMLIEPIPPETARVAHAAFRKGNRYLRVADELDMLFTDEAFEPMFKGMWYGRANFAVRRVPCTR
jgi:transposase